MNSDNAKSLPNRAICMTCKKVVPAHHEERAGQVVLVKECPDHGREEVIVSTNSRRYQEKRDVIGYQGEAQKTCLLNCTECKAHKLPSLVFIDVTNRCNMNCPICLANIPAMGFRFDPPMEYFEKIFQVLAAREPKPKIQLFGGEPTVRQDLIEMIELAKKKYGLSARVVTNGLKLADEEYCKKLVATGTQIMFSYDGADEEVNDRTRKHATAVAKKLKALENLKKFRKSKVTIMATVGVDTNGKGLRELVEYCHEQRGLVAALDMIPLTATWGPEQVDARNTTIEDIERLAAEALPGWEFFSAGAFYKLAALRETFNLGRITFGGAHPNCEAVSLLVSDGQRYRPLSSYMKRPFQEGVRALIEFDGAMAEKLKSSLLARLFGARGRKLAYGLALWRVGRQYLNLREIFGGAALPGIAKIGFGLACGRKMKDLLRAHTRCHAILRTIILPFVEPMCVESARLVDCPAAFAYEHPQTGEIKFMPVCAWPIFKDATLRKTAERYGAGQSAGDNDLVQVAEKA